MNRAEAPIPEVSRAIRHVFSLESTSMCGRCRLSRRKEILAQHFGVPLANMDWEPRHNIAPTQPVPVVRRDCQGATL